jgi:hypothetical protein
VATQARAAQRKTRWHTPPPRPASGTHAQPYRRRRPEVTTLHRIVREHLETYLALANEADPMGDGVPDHVEKEFRSYLTCGLLEPHDAQDMLTWDHGGGFSLNASVRIEATDRTGPGGGLQRPGRYLRREQGVSFG